MMVTVMSIVTTAAYEVPLVLTAEGMSHVLLRCRHVDLLPRIHHCVKLLVSTDCARSIDGLIRRCDVHDGTGEHGAATEVQSNVGSCGWGWKRPGECKRETLYVIMRGLKSCVLVVTSAPRA